MLDRLNITRLSCLSSNVSYIYIYIVYGKILSSNNYRASGININHAHIHIHTHNYKRIHTYTYIYTHVYTSTYTCTHWLCFVYVVRSYLFLEFGTLEAVPRRYRLLVSVFHDQLNAVVVATHAPITRHRYQCYAIVVECCVHHPYRA